MSIIDAPRLRRTRLHFIAVCELNSETWLHIRRESDDHYEWLPHSKQTDQLGVPISDRQIDAWLRMMDQLEGLLKGERLVPASLLRFVSNKHPEGWGLNLAKVLDDPPSDLLNVDRLQEKGISSLYLKAEENQKLFDFTVMEDVASLFNGPVGFFSVIRMN